MSDNPTIKRDVVSPGTRFDELVEIIRTLRSPQGCPWDRKQTPVTLKPYIIEEAYEVLEAIDSGNPCHIREELGDLLLQIMLQSQIAHEEGTFNVGDVIGGLIDKMVSRHPHVFGDVQVNDAEEVLTNWERIKASEKKERRLLDGVPNALPAVLKAYRMGQKAGRIGFDWKDSGDVRAKVVEELDEVDEAVFRKDAIAISHEIGDLLFSVVQWARHLGCDAEDALDQSCQRFKQRFYGVQALARERNRSIQECSVDELEEMWQEIKVSLFEGADDD